MSEEQDDLRPGLEAWYRETGRVKRYFGRRMDRTW